MGYYPDENKVALLLFVSVYIKTRLSSNQQQILTVEETLKTGSCVQCPAYTCVHTNPVESYRVIPAEAEAKSKKKTNRDVITTEL